MNDSRESKNQKICAMLHAKDEKGMELLFNTYYKVLVVWADVFLRDMNMAEDVVQDFFLHVWNNKIYLKFEPTTLVSFLYVSIRNRCLNRL
mgnify:FL=1